ncbi:rod shape-determining protein MreC [Flavobacterium azooxidireducens]|uniref:Cell shape-determining protein MreC n=1 Tax=Flavobacterium azooxidireducens TaxID=1871076 RepID=A0ABY4KE94_9FLAO|nr:rod shape-determining protein MreC [Flavobacterium azooxidireducens]UPQ77812.1 rod shape-determining protein MreC [Flavobacterium azooxidireducens]
MQQIFIFIIKNSTRLLFLLLLVISLLLTIQSHSYHRSKVINSANFVTGGVYERINSVNEYLNLKTENEGLANENARLKSLLYNRKDTTKIIDKELLSSFGNYKVIQSKIINNSYNVHENFLTINSGTAKGVKSDMGVVNSKGIIGIVENTSKNYATVISILNVRSQINAKIKKTSHFGTLTWNGKNTGYVQLIDVPRLASVKKGDTIVTGAQSIIFPENVNIGTIHKIYTDDKTNYFTIDVKLFNDMTSLGHVYIIENIDRKEILELENQNQNE